MRKDVRALPFAGLVGRLARATRPAAPARPALAPAPAAAAVAWLPPLPGTHVGLGQVLRTTPDGRPVVRLDDAYATETAADWALPYRYVARPGDALLVVGRDGRYWVTAVVHGRGRSELYFRGDARLRAGRLRLRGDRGLRLRGGRVAVRARALEVVAGTIQEKVESAVVAVKGLLSQRAGACRRVTAEEERVQGRNVTVLAAERLRMDGDSIMVS